MGVDLRITQAHLDAARRAGACKPSLEGYCAGMQIGEVDQEDLLWATEHLPTVAAQIEEQFGVPLWAMADRGCGDGDEHAYGWGDDFGDGDGFGHSFGCWDGHGFGASSTADPFSAWKRDGSPR